MRLIIIQVDVDDISTAQAAELTQALNAKVAETFEKAGFGAASPTVTLLDKPGQPAHGRVEDQPAQAPGQEKPASDPADNPRPGSSE